MSRTIATRTVTQRNGTVLGGGWRAEVLLGECAVTPRWWLWLPPLALWRIFQFPYTVFLTKTDYPYGHIEGVAVTLPGARRIARRGLARRARLTPERTIVETLR